MAILDQVKEFIPDWSVEKIFAYVSWFLILLVASVLTGLLLYWWFTKKKFNVKIIIFEKINGVVQITQRDTASIVKIGTTGDRVLLLNKLKNLGNDGYLSMPKYKMGHDTYPFYKREEDGELINFKFKDIDETLNELNVKIGSIDLSYARASLQKLLKENYKKSSWLKELLPYIGFGFLIFMIAISTWLLAGKVIEILNAIIPLLETANVLADRQEQILGALENVCSTSGLRPIG